jgi:enamine deaminase RidA (YjgF/YER057c/UK114 family)
MQGSRSVSENAWVTQLLQYLTAVGLRRPFARYSHGVAVSAGARLVFCSGQLGVRPDDTVPAGVEAQAELCFENIKAILGEAGLSLSDIVRINAYVTAREHMKGYMEVRDRSVGDPPPASTLMIVAGFTRPEFVVEVEAIAAAPS